MQQGISTSTSMPLLQGQVHGGQQPVSAASISLYAAGSSGNGTGATNLLLPHVVTTDVNGNFSITGDYTCPSPTTQVYLVAQGGNPGLAAGTNNTALTLITALGSCSSLTDSTYIFVNEVTTVAAAWALNQFLGPAANIGSSPTNATGLANAFLVANNLASTVTGSTPGTALPAGTSLETSKLNTLANALAACVNSDGTSACQPLFAAATTGPTVPANTLDAALNIVRNPASNVAAVFSAAAAKSPFQPNLASAPHDWTISVTYGNCTSTCGGLSQPGSVAVDAAGSVWVANYASPVLSKFSATGVPAQPAGFPSIGLRESYGVTIDVAGNAWVTNQQSVTGANNHHYGSVSEFSTNGLELSGYGFTGGGTFYPQAIAADSNGDIWVADNGSSAATLLASDGSPISGSNGFGPSQLPFASAVAIDANHNAWFGVERAVVTVTPTGAVTSYSCCNYPFGIAVDQAGNVWVADYGAYSVVELNSSGVVQNRLSTQSASNAPSGIAVDGAGNIWTANYVGNSVTAINGASATVTSPAGGFGLDASLLEPYGIAADASGNLWISNSAGNTLTQLVGLASPVATPVLGPPQTP